MHRLTTLLAPGDPEAETETETLTLPYDLRRKARLRATLDGGLEVGLDLPRSLALRDGDRLQSDDGKLTVTVRAASEPLSVASTSDTLLLTRAAYHLGNRHVALQIRPGRLTYQHDHVLDGLCRELGLTVSFASGPFEPELGGYAGGHHGHSHNHDSNHHHHHPEAENVQ